MSLVEQRKTFDLRKLFFVLLLGEYYFQVNTHSHDKKNKACHCRMRIIFGNFYLIICKFETLKLIIEKLLNLKVY
jgi:hypothetical protein